ncbi:MAG TPA: entericidin A/B family lipoprotein [Aquabacterium sp.]|nr:entericidin A/B family lipoprotein [Aquabacterium sp.]
MSRLITALAAIALVLGLSACNTIKGMGQDIQKAGGAIENAAKK